MPSFEEWCGIERARVQKSPTLVSAVVRFNRNEQLIVVTRSDEYNHESRPDGTDPLQQALQLAPVIRIYSVYEKLRKEHRSSYTHPLQRDVQYWDGITDAYRRNQNNVDLEARMIYQEWIKVGIDRDYGDAVERARMQAVERANQQLRAAMDAARDKKAEISNFDHHADVAARDAAMKDWRPHHGHPRPYPEELLDDLPPMIGGHAEENLIRIWTNVAATVRQLDGTIGLVELFLTRMPCASRSEPLRMLDGTVYKEGCVNKLIQLVAGEDPSIKWVIEWDQELTGDAQPLSVVLSEGFPDNVMFRRWQAQ